MWFEYIVKETIIDRALIGNLLKPINGRNHFRSHPHQTWNCFWVS